MARAENVIDKQALDQWLFGERFHLRSPLTQGECKRRIAQYSTGLTPSVTTDLNAFCIGDRVFVNMQLDRTTRFVRRTPVLVGKMRPTGSSTEIIGRSGGDLIAFWLSVAMEMFLAWNLLLFAPGEHVLWLTLLFPAAALILLRRSREGGQLIDFLQQLLEAENVLTRAGDPIVRV
jgi:hypothetical protein